MFFDPHTTLLAAQETSFKSTVIVRRDACASADKTAVILVGFYSTRAKAKYAARCAARDLRRLFEDESK